MKKLTMFLIGAMMVLSLAACTPTPEKKAKETAGGPVEKVEMETGGISDKVPDPNVVPEDQVLIYFPDEAGTKLDSKMDSVPELNAQAVVDKLIEYKVLSEGTKVVNFDTKDSVGTLNISQLPTEGDKKMIIAAVEQTFIDDFELDDVTLQVNGEKASE